MRQMNFSIRTTLLVIISILNLVIAGQMGYNVYVSWLNHRDAQRLKQSAEILNFLYDAEKYLSLERGTSMSVLYTHPSEARVMIEEMNASRHDATGALARAFHLINAARLPTVAVAMNKVKTSETELAKLRTELDSALLQLPTERDPNLINRFFDTSTTLIMDIHDLTEVYSIPVVKETPNIGRRLRFFNLVWGITEYTGREYAILGQLIAENKVPTPEMQEKLAMWRGRVQYGWELVHGTMQMNEWGDEVQPFMQEAETHYFMTFDQIKGLFSPEIHEGVPVYPISTEMWLELAAQAVDSLHAMDDSILRLNQVYINNVESQARQGAMISLILFGCALALSFYSWQVIIQRVVSPINLMADALYKATQGKPYRLPPITNAHDEIGKLASVLEILQQNARQLEEERDKAQAANIAKSEFLATMSHEIRTPMNVILGLSRILGKTPPLTEKQKEFIRTLQLSAESLLSIINDLLDISKIETKNFELEHIPFNLSKIIEEVLQQIYLKTQEKGLILQSNLETIRSREFMGDPTRIRQVLMNLCGNAVKFTEKGSITIEVNSAPGEAENMEDISISLTDTGVGIAPDKLDMIFEKFTQADSSITRKYGGTGLGLAITKAFVEVMGGHITVESTPGKGSTFTVHLPLEKKAASSKLPKRKAKAPAKTELPSKHGPVLLVEDYQPNAMVATEYLRQFGFEYDVAESGYQALEKIQKRIYDAILMDVQMQGLDGYQATHAIRKFEKDHARKPSKIIGMTAHALVGDREKCLAAGMDDYLSKPFNPEELREKLVA